MVKPEKVDGWKHIVANVERLVADANLLQANARYASALSTAILAFEEAGKGSNYEVNFGISRKGKANVYSWHMLRQIVSSFFLSASLLQKYGLPPGLSDASIEAIKAHWDGFDNMKAGALEPIPDEMRKMLREDMAQNVELRAAMEKLTKEDFFIFRLEQRWTQKLMVSAMSGQTEAMRQKGMYVDFSGEDVTSTPLSISGTTSQYWINAAERALLILRDGNFKAPYGSLAGYLESLERPFDPLAEVMDVEKQTKWLEKKVTTSTKATTSSSA